MTDKTVNPPSGNFFDPVNLTVALYRGGPVHGIPVCPSCEVRGASEGPMQAKFGGSVPRMLVAPRGAMSAWRVRSTCCEAVRHTSRTSSREFGSSARGVTRIVGGGSAGGSQEKREKWQQGKGGGRRGSWAQEGLSFVRDMTWLVCTYHCLKEYVAEPCLVRGPSMRPTIEHGSWLLINKVKDADRARPWVRQYVCG